MDDDRPALSPFFQAGIDGYSRDPFSLKSVMAQFTGELVNIVANDESLLDGSALAARRARGLVANLAALCQLDDEIASGDGSPEAVRAAIMAAFPPPAASYAVN